ncbi:hypothetical protein Hte_010326 [Hypoxylon texense]
MSKYPHPSYSQPGLEVAHSNYPEVVPLPEENYPIPVNEQIPYKAEGGSSYSDVSYNPITGPYAGPHGGYNELSTDQRGMEAPAKGDGSKKKLFILIGVLVAVAVIVGAVVGGVLGSKASKDGSKAAQTTGTSSSPSESTSSPSPSSGSATPQVNTTAVRPNTRLSVTGRRVAGDGFTSRLFWQGGDNKIRTSRYNSAGGGAWTAPLVFDGTSGARPGTPIAATVYLAFPQFELFYLDAGSSTFRGANFGEDETVPKVDSVNTDRPAFAVEGGSRMAAYWPYVIYQDADSTFRREVYDSHNGGGWFNDTMQGWFDTSVVPFGDSGTGMAIVPVVKEYKGPYAAGIAFRDQDGRLAIFSFGGDDTGISWHSGTPNVAIPAGTSIAAFAVGRANSNTTNTYVLYQDADHKIQSVWQEDGKAWEGPQEVGAADAGTDIACLTEVVCDEPEQTLLSEQLDMRRCYYQSGGLIVEKRLTSSGWVDGETIPME